MPVVIMQPEALYLEEMNKISDKSDMAYISSMPQCLEYVVCACKTPYYYLFTARCTFFLFCSFI